MAGQIQFLSEVSRVRESTKGPERQGPFCKTSSRTRKAHIKFRELSYHTSQIAKQRDVNMKIIFYGENVLWVLF